MSDCPPVGILVVSQCDKISVERHVLGPEWPVHIAFGSVMRILETSHTLWWPRNQRQREGDKSPTSLPSEHPP